MAFGLPLGSIHTRGSFSKPKGDIGPQLWGRVLVSLTVFPHISTLQHSFGLLTLLRFRKSPPFVNGPLESIFDVLLHVRHWSNHFVLFSHERNFTYVISPILLRYFSGRYIGLCSFASWFQIHDFYCNILFAQLHMLNSVNHGNGANSMQVYHRLSGIIYRGYFVLQKQSVNKYSVVKFVVYSYR